MDKITTIDNLDKRIQIMQNLVHELNGHPIYGHMVGTRNNQISSIMRQLCDHLILIQQDLKFLKFMESYKGGKKNGDKK